MRKSLGFAALFMSLAVGITLGARLFFPWEKALELVFLRISQRAVSIGLDLSAREFEVSGLLPSFRIKGLKVLSFMGETDIKDVSVTPLLFKTLLARSPKASLTLDQGTMPLGETSGSFSGSVICSLRDSVIATENWDVTGDLALKGFLYYSAALGKITKAHMSLRVPDSLDGALSLASSMVPLKKQGPGEWVISRKEEGR